MAQAPDSRTDDPRPSNDADPAAPAGTKANGTPGQGETEGGTRRGLLIGAALAGVAGLAAACGGGGEGSGGGGNGGGGGGAPKALAGTGDIPVGGGKVFKDENVVVVQPTQGQFKAYDAACTHRGCTVEGVSGGLIDCRCHGSKFKITDGSVANPPADRPLPGKQITVQGDQIMLT